MSKTINFLFVFVLSLQAICLRAKNEIEYTRPEYELGVIYDYPVDFIANDDSVVVTSEETNQTFVLAISGNGFHCCALDLNNDGYKDYYFFSDYGGQRDSNCVMIFNPSSEKFEQYFCDEDMFIDHIIVVPSLNKTFVSYYSCNTYHYGAVKFENGKITNDGLMWVTRWDPVKQKEYHGYYDPHKGEIVKKISAKRSIYKDIVKVYESLGM